MGLEAPQISAAHWLTLPYTTGRELPTKTGRWQDGSPMEHLIEAPPPFRLLVASSPPPTQRSDIYLAELAVPRITYRYLLGQGSTPQLGLGVS
jgi:hypothetical protein